METVLMLVQVYRHSLALLPYYFHPTQSNMHSENPFFCQEKD